MNASRIVKKGNYKDMDYDNHYYDCDIDFHHYEYTLVNGEIHGAFYVYYPSGQRKWKKTYKNGVEEGLQLQWHENGMLALRFYKKDGETVGDYYAYSVKGVLIGKDYMSEDTGRYEKKSYNWYITGEIYQECVFEYVDGDRIVHVKNYHTNGCLALESFFNSTTRRKTVQKWDEAGAPIPA